VPKALLIALLLILILAGGAAVLTTKPLLISLPTSSVDQPKLITPQSGDTITGPLVIKGYIPKSWVFEGQFQMRLLDADRQPIPTDSTSVPVDWNQNSESLYFVQTYNFHTSSPSGFLILENDNPSGLPQNKKSIEVPINFSLPPTGTVYLFDQFTGNSQVDASCQVVLPRAFNLGLSKTPIKDTLSLLAKSMHPDFYIKSLNLKNGLLTIEFPNVPGFTTGGSCAQNVNRLKVEKTALQFPEVKEIKIIPDSIFQP
jgi:hypothetical protein